MGKSYGKRGSSTYGRRTIKVRVKATPFRKGYVAERPDLGRPDIGPKLIPIVDKGSLTRYGYSIKKAAAERVKALDKAVKKYGALSVWRKLEAQVRLRKRTQPKARGIFQSDADYIKVNYKLDGFSS